MANTSLTFRFALRYLFAWRSVNVINLVTGLSVAGLGVGAAAVLLVLSVFNGFETVIAGMFNKFNSEVLIIPARGKTIQIDSFPLAELRNFEGVEHVSLVLEETVFFQYKESRAFGRLKGVDSVYEVVSDIDDALVEGQFSLRDGERSMAIIGLGIRNKLDINIGDIFEPIQVYAARREQSGALDRPFRIRSVYPTATFAIQQDYDQRYVLSNLQLAQEILDAPGQVSGIELRSSPGIDGRVLADRLQDFLGDGLVVQDRYDQDAELMRLMNIEKWMSYAILTLVLFLVSFNLIGGLWLIVLEKQHDVAILRAMGADDAMIWKIFLGLGFLLSAAGLIFGLILALALYYAQIHYGLVRVPEGLVVSAYPIEMRWIDVLVVVLTVFAIGLVASIPASRRASRIQALDFKL